MPIWIPLALLAPALTGVVNILDKLIVDLSPRTIYYYVFWIGVYELVAGSIILGGAVGIQGLDAATLPFGVLAGAVSAGGLFLYLAALRLGQVARVVPIWYMYPLMVVPLAAGFLGERLPPVAYGAILPAVAGAVLISWQGGAGGRTFANPVVVVLALAAGVCVAVSFVLSKHALEEGEFWQFLGSYRIGFAPVMLGFLIMPDVRRRAVRAIRDRRLMGLLVAVEALVTIVLIVRFLAVDMGPVSLVAAISSVQPALVLFYSLGLATLSPGRFGTWITRGTLRPQLAGIVCISMAVLLITLSSES